MKEILEDKIYVLTDFLLGEELSSEAANMVFEEHFTADDLRSFVQYCKDHEADGPTFDKWYEERFPSYGGGKAEVLTAGVDTWGNTKVGLVSVEITKGIGIHITGLNDTVAKETLLRVCTAIQALGYTLPGNKVLIDINEPNPFKSNTGYDLPIAVAILIASGRVRPKEGILHRCLLCGELGLDGSLRAGKGLNGYDVAKWMDSNADKPPFLLTAPETAIQASVAPEALTFSFRNLADLLGVLTGDKKGTEYLVYHTTEYQEMQTRIYKTCKWQKEL